jgi:hypothetical protein
VLAAEAVEDVGGERRSEHGFRKSLAPRSPEGAPERGGIAVVDAASGAPETRLVVSLFLLCIARLAT